MVINEELRKEFAEPSAKYRPIPFWSWNDELSAEEIKKQADMLHEGGMGGYFMHARSGLKTEYLSEDWFSDIEAGIDEGGKNGMGAWIYDEEGWPSGFAGGRVPALGEDYQAKFITASYAAAVAELPEDSRDFLFILEEGGKRYHRLNPGEIYECRQGERVIGIKRHVNPFYIDTMNKRAVKAFLKCTHEEYYKRFAAKFGREMKGFFTDEPRLTCNNFGDIAWSDDLPEVFREKYCYDILNELPALFMETAGYKRIRYDFWCTVNRMFSVNYMKTIQDWCHEHNCSLTGHIMMEESIFSQMTSTAGVMPFYEYEDIPGIDWLRRCIDTPVTPKQVGSVACQLGKKQVLTESFALCGWGVTFEELKWIAEWQFVNGVDQICQHLMAYDIKGVRKRDYPPSHFYQQTWWKDASLFNDYLARECVALSYGDQTADVLLIHPLRSGYIAYDGTRTAEICRIDDEFAGASVALSGQHISYHYGDETIISKYGSVSGDTFTVGKTAYRTVILPYMSAIDGYTLRLLNKFADNGGRILSLGKLPEFTNGEMGLLDGLKARVTEVAYSNIRAELLSAGLLSMSISPEGRENEQITDISFEQRRKDGNRLYFLVNHSQKNTYDACVRIYGFTGTVMQLMPESGKICNIPYDNEGRQLKLSLRFEPMQSYILLAEPGGDGQSNMPEVLPVQYIKPGKEWSVQSMGVNSLTLDTCDFSADGGEWQKNVPVIKVQDALLNLLKLRRACDVKLKFAFITSFEKKTDRHMALIVEDARRYEIRVNGSRIEESDICGTWKDRSFDRIDIERYVRDGANEIMLQTRFTQPQKVYEVLFGENVYETEKNKITYDTELESIYIIGDFGVYANDGLKETERHAYATAGVFELHDSPKDFEGLELTHQGLLFFADVLKVSQKLQIKKKKGARQVLKLGKQRAPLIKVYVNGMPAKNSMWAPYEADITDLCSDGENTVTFELFASNRNLLGPHHHIDGECYNVGPESFTGKWSWVERKSEADATDISGRDRNYWTDSYSFIKFGME